MLKNEKVTINTFPKTKITNQHSVGKASDKGVQTSHPHWTNDFNFTRWIDITNNSESICKLVNKTQFNNPQNFEYMNIKLYNTLPQLIY